MMYLDSSKHVLIAEGLLLLHHLLRVLESGSGFAKEKACVVLHSLSFTKENARAIESRGGISSLLEICEAVTPNSQAMAASVLRNLASFTDTRNNFIEEDAISVLLTLSVLAQDYSIACLSNLARDDDNLKLLIARKGAIDCLRSFWDSAIRSFEVAVDLLRRFAGSVVTRKQEKNWGNTCVPPLIAMLEGKSVEEKQAAAKALSTILVCLGNRRIYKKEQRGIASVVQLLDPTILNLDKKYPVSILMSLTHSKKCCKQIVDSGGLVYLQKLVELEVDGAKKLQETISHGKLWDVFARR
ncbi:putative armadillo-like helical protein [Helianthus annuus]|nr:putative armadillo-like helical protein [Helianthus annuus]